MAHLTLRDAFEIYKGLGVPKFRGIQQRTCGMNRAAWRRAMKDSKMYKDHELAKCLIAFDAACRGNNVMTFEDFEIALAHAGKQKKMSGSDVGLIIVHKAMKIVEEESSTGKIQRGTPTLESLKEEMRKELAKGKEKVKMGPPPIKKPAKKRYPKDFTKKDSVSGSVNGPSSAKSSAEGGLAQAKALGESAGLCAREPEEMIEAAENDKEKNKKEEEEEEEEEVDFRAIAARNQYLEEQTKTLENLNAILKKGEGLEEKEMKKLVKQDKSGRWDYTSATGTIHLEHPAYWDWA